ncbi:MAG: hypothetical protein R3D25_01620 [Geminicoccaceae bacterium]
MARDDRQHSHLDQAERSVGLPFTTPLISGAKARLVPTGGVELLAPNPSGHRGYYVMDLRSLRDYCQLSVHDELLLDKLLAVDVVTPATVRRAAREVAIEGAAGRDAAAAAKRAAERDAAIVNLMNYLMLMRLLRAVGIDERELQRSGETGRAVQLEIKRRLTSLSPRLGMTADEVIDAVGDIAFYAAAIGFADGDLETRHRRVLERLSPFGADIRQWAALESDDGRECAEQIADCAKWTSDKVAPLIADCQARLEDIPELVRAWRHDGGVLKGRFGLPDWLLDGWPEILALWDSASGEGRAAQRAVAAQIHRLMPLAQTQAEGRSVEVMQVKGTMVHSRQVKLHEDWRTGVVMGGIRARTEALRAGVA